MSSSADEPTGVEGGRDFPPTSWGFIQGLAHADPEARRQAFDSLCRRYWRPIYHYARAAWAKSDVEGKDLTQDFFVWLLEADPLRNYAPDRGSFRPYLKSLLRHFSADRHDRERAAKRGGGVRVLRLDDPVAPLREPAADPDRAFEIAWKEELLGRAVRRAREWYEAAGRPLPFRAFEAYDLGDAAPSYDAVAASLGVKTSDVRNWLFEVRERVRTGIREELALTEEGDVDGEWKALFGGS